jgi:competence protein ComGC
MSKFRLANEFWLYLRSNKKFWLLPILIVLLLMSALLIFAQSSVLSPFIYSIF